MAGFFFGRKAERERLMLLAREPVALVYGLPGIGKSELVYQLEGELLASLPLRVTRVIVEPHMEDVLPGYLLARISDRAGGLSELTELLVREPHLLVIDDAHHAASSVAALVDAMMRRTEPASRIIVTSRVALPAVTSPIIVKLGPLSLDEARALALHIAERQGVRLADLDAVIAQSAGSPFLLRHLVAGRRRGTTSDDPIQASIDLLDTETRQSLIRLAAVSGCSQSRLAAARLVPDDRVFESLSDQFLVDAGPDRLVVHGLVRERVMGGADPRLVSDSRRTAALVLWESYELHNHPLVAVESICLSASSGDLDSAFARLRAASRSISNAGLDHLLLPVLQRLALDGHAGASLLAARIFLRMAQIDDAARALAATPPGLEESVPLLVARATIAERACRLDVATADFENALQIAPTGRARTMLQMRLAIVRALAGDDEEVARLTAEIATNLPAPGDVDLARLGWMGAVILALQLRWAECLAATQEGRRAAQRAGAVDLDYLLLLIELMATSELGDVAASGKLAADVAQSQPNQYLRQRMTLLYVGVSELAQGHVGRAVVTLERAFHEYDLHHDTLLALLAGHYWGRALLIHGEMAKSVDVLARVAQRAQDAGLRPLLAPGQLHLARALVSVGRVAEATQIAERLVDGPQDLVAGEARALLAYKHAFQGDLDRARIEITAALAQVGDREPIWANVILDHAYIELLGGDPERARALALSIVEDARRMNRPYSRGRALFILATADLAAGMIDTAIVTLAEIDALADEYGMNYLRGRTALLRSATSHHGASILERVPAEHQRGYLGILRVLGLRPETVIVTSRSGRVHTDAPTLPAIALQHDILVDLTNGTIIGRSGRIVEGRGVAASILVNLAEATEPVSAERLHQVVWGGHDYHPLRHRNTLYIALNRTRKLLAELGEAREVIRRDGDGWIISPEIDLAIARRDPRVSTVTESRFTGSVHAQTK